MHEMITGRRAFEGKSQVLLISAIATADPPPLSRVQPAVPPALDHVVSMCLAKDPDDRWQTARDLRAELQWVADGGSVTQLVAADASARPKRWRVTRLLLAGAGVLIALLAVPAVAYFRGISPPDRLEIRVATTPLTYGGNPALNGFFAMSPDGRQLVVRADPPGPEAAALYVGSLDFRSPRRLPGTEDAFQPFWAADGGSIGFVANGRLYRTDAGGGRPQQICSAPDFRGGAWNRQGVILFGTTSGLFSVPAQGGQPSAVTTVEGPQAGHFWPSFLPDGRRFLFLVYTPQPTDREIVSGSLDSKERTRIVAAPATAVYSSGHLIFWRDRNLYAQRLDPEELRLEGEPTRLADAVPYNPNSGHAGFGVSDNGAVAFYRDTTVDTAAGADALEWQLAWVDRVGQNPEYLGKPANYRGVEVSPNGRRIAVHRHDLKGGDVLVLEPNGTETRITFDVSHENSNPVWSPDGLRITYASRRNGKWGLYEAASDGSGREQLLVESELPKVPLAWSPDGALLLYWVRDPRTAGDLWVLRANGDRKAQPVVATLADERHGQISGDGKWVAYSATAGGGRREVFVQPFPSGSGRWQISPDANAGGDWPRWSPATNELLYHSLGNGVGIGVTTPSNQTVFIGPLFSARWKAVGSTFIPEPPREVVRFFALDLPHEGGDYHTFGLSPDGQRILTFLVVGFAATSVVTPELSPDPAAGLTVLMNWK
jgi:Tol biopolymer transport system component